MTDILIKAYANIFGSKPDPTLKEWELARAIMANWDVPALGEDLARECIFRIVNHTDFPTPETTKEVVGLAEDKATELFPELEGVDPHMDVIAHLERQHRERTVPETEKPHIK
jgi:hypothetical protein